MTNTDLTKQAAFYAGAARLFLGMLLEAEKETKELRKEVAAAYAERDSYLDLLAKEWGISED